MKPIQELVFQGRVLDEGLRLDRAEFRRLCGISDDLLVRLVQEGLVQPIEPHRAPWQFTGLAFRRIQRALRIHRDLETDWPSTALVLDLLEELEALRRRVRCLEGQLGMHQHD